MSETQDTSRDETAEEVKVEHKIPFSEQLDSAVRQNTDQFYQDVLKQADERMQSLAEQVHKLQAQQLEFRDEIAVRCFVPLMNIVGDYPKAAISAYQAADAFLRARESGVNVAEVPETEL